MNILPTLLAWQKSQSHQEGVEGYMIVPFKTLREIAQMRPQTEEALLAIKGIGPAKVRRYGAALLAICRGEAQSPAEEDFDTVNALLSGEVSHGGEVALDDLSEAGPGHERVPAAEQMSLVQRSTESVIAGADPEESSSDLTVSEFLTGLNGVMRSYFSSVRIRGEVVGFKQHTSGHAYFEIKDASAVLRCSVFRSAYERSGVTLSDGMEIIITGAPQHHERYGFSFIGEHIELAGEGALKKAYDDLKKKLDGEGLLAQERKRALPELPERIGLITSATGAAIGDFMTNVGSFGYAISFASSRVEGGQAVKDLLDAIALIKEKDVDVLVIVRGGGSLESLQAFNNENVVRALAAFPVPVVAGVGHEQDETLTTLVADVGVSTPTAAARAVRESWDSAHERVLRTAHMLETYLDRTVQDVTARIAASEQSMLSSYQDALQTVGQRQLHAMHTIESGVTRALQHYKEIIVSVTHAFDACQRQIQKNIQTVTHAEHVLTAYDPRRQLARGYSITYDEDGHVIRSIHQVTEKQKLSVHLSDGSINMQKTDL